MLRRVFNFTAILSLVLLAATVALWVRSYVALDELSLSLGKVEAHTSSFCSHFQLQIETSDARGQSFHWHATPIENIDMVSVGPLFRFKVGGDPYMGLVRVKPILAINLPIPVAVAASVLALFLALRWRPHLKNHCSS